MLPAAEQHLGLDGRGSLEVLHATDRSRGSLPDPERRVATASDLAPNRRASPGTHSGVFSGIRPAQDAGRLVPACRLGPEPTDTLGGIRADPKHRRAASYYQRTHGAAAVRGAP